MKQKLIAAFLLVSLFTSPLTYSSDIDKGLEAYNQGDYQQVYEIFRPLAEDGDSSAQFKLGVMNSHGQGVAQNFNEAVHWFRAAAEQGHSTAMSKLGLMYVIGEGVVQDYSQAYMWFNIAASQGDQDAVDLRDLVSDEMTPAQIQEAQRLAQEWVNSR